MQLGITQLLLPELSTPDFIAAAADAGYETVELGLKRTGDLTADTTDADLDRYAAAARDAGVTLSSIVLLHRTGDLLAGGASRDTAIAETIRGLEIAQRLGIPVALHTLGRLSAEVYYDDAYENALTGLQQLIPACQRTGVDLAAELIWNGFLFSPLEYKRFLDEVNSPRIGFYYDPGNMAVFHPPQHWARILGPHIKRVHAKDWQGKARNGDWTALGEGDVDFVAVFTELRAAGYDGPFISEVDVKLASIEDTLAAMRRIVAA